MISQELMLNDWVEVISNDHLKYVQIKEIYQSSILTKEFEFESEEVSIDNIKPIPLTPEILEKNGFEYNDENAKYHPNCWSNSGILLRKRTLNGFFYMVTSDYDDQDTNCTPIIITYVHELQHLLKLCGIEKTIEP